MDSTARIVSSYICAIKQADLPARDTEQLKHVIGLGLNEAVDYLYPEKIDASKHQVLIKAYRYQYLEANTTPSPLFDGVREMLENFSSQGYKMAIATGKSRAGLNRTLHKIGMQSLFPISRCADESGSKPDPAMINEILGEYGIEASQALMIGDTEFDINMAHRASVDVVAITQGAHSKQQLVKARPKTILDHINQLPLWLAEQPVR